MVVKNSMIRKLICLCVQVVVAFSLISCVFSPPSFDEAAWRREVEGQKPEKLRDPHFADGKYFAPWSDTKHGGFMRLLKWKLSRKQDYTDEEKTFLPEVIRGLTERIKSMSSEDFIAWIGHSTFLMRIDGEYFLTDPIFSDRALLPGRKTPPAITGNELGEITSKINVLVSHNHYDHLDAESLRSLPGQARIFVPMGLKGYVEGLERKHVEEMDWWQTFDLGRGMKVVCLPAQHWSRRIGQGVNATLWASFMIVTPKITIYYAADSGYFIGYKEIGRLFPDIDYALMPATAYQPRWFMHYAHMDIRETIDAFKELGAKYFIPTQWGTFHLGDEPPGYPVIELNKMIQEEKLDPSRFIIMNIGEIVPLVKK